MNLYKFLCLEREDFFMERCLQLVLNFNYKATLNRSETITLSEGEELVCLISSCKINMFIISHHN